jgi:hypothetical protein
MSKALLLWTFVLCPLISVAQQDSFKIVSTVKGDLNKDKLIDSVIVSQDTIAPTFPYKLQIFFSAPDGTPVLIASSSKVIEPQYPDGKEVGNGGIGFSDITINSGVLSIHYEFIRGHCEFKFRYRKGNFELTEFSYANADGLGTVSSIDHNLVTGIKIKKSERYDTGETGTSKKEKIKVRPLPSLQNMDGRDNYLYWYH